MGTRGPARTPTEKLKRRGSKRGKKRAKTEVQPPRDGIAPPPEMTPRAIEIWNRILPVVTKMKVMTAADVGALARYCELFVDWWDANAFVKKNGPSYPIYNTDKHGNKLDVKCVAQFPQVSIVRNLSVTLLRLEQQFGLTPAARAGLDPTEKDDDVPDWMKKLLDQQNKRMTGSRN